MPSRVNLPLIVAHRGASAHAPENTLAAFRLAMDVGAEGIEFDVRLAKDDVPVVFHDEDLVRIATRPVKISGMTSAELSGIDAGTWFNRAFPDRARTEYGNETVPTFFDTLSLLSSFRGRIYVEIKCSVADAETAARSVCQSIRDSPLLPQIVVKSFELTAIPHVRRLCPAVRTAALFEPTVGSVLSKRKNIIDAALRCGADELSLHHSLATRRLADLAREKNMPITIWTVDRPAWLLRARERGVLAVITNDPARMLKTRNKIVGRDGESAELEDPDA